MSEPLEGAAGSKRGRGSKWGRVSVAVAAATEGQDRQRGREAHWQQLLHAHATHSLRNTNLPTGNLRQHALCYTCHLPHATCELPARKQVQGLPRGRGRDSTP